MHFQNFSASQFRTNYEYHILKGRRFNILYFLILFISLLISLLGCLALFSASSGETTYFAYKQGVILGVCFCVSVIISLISIKFFHKVTYYLYFFCFVLLVVADIAGHNAMGAQRWLNLGIFNIQPSEWSKIAIIMALASYFDKIRYNERKGIKMLLLPLLLIILPVVLILHQPNLGMAAVIVLISVSMFFAAGVNKLKFFIVFACILLVTPVVWNNFLHDYQKKRILTFLDPEKDTLGAAYNVIQSKITIGSGGLYGKGFLNGTQNQFGFLPEKHTDFIFAILAEEFGFFAVLFVLFLYWLLIALCYIVAMKAQTHYAALLVFGICSMIFVQLFINIGMITGLLPVVGIPLPFMSYGGSNLSSVFIGIGLVLNVCLQKME